jgi:thiol-disulfide isomerase/thioredoxin
MQLPLFKSLLILTLLGGLAFLLPHCTEEETAPALAPDFTLRTLDGQEILLSKLRGKVVLLDFWATWCTPCKESIPTLMQIYKTYQPKGLEIIGMNMDRGDVSSVLRVVKSMEIPYPIVITPDEVQKKYGITGLPTAILLDKQGRIRDKLLGFNSKIGQRITARVSEFISENP